MIFSGRQAGKTYTIMNEIHDLIVAGRRAEVLIVFPNMTYLHWWTRMWESMFPHIPMPKYVSIGNTMSVRGLRVAKIYVEDIDGYENGIYDERFNNIWPALFSALNDEEVVFTCSPFPLNQRSHSQYVTVADVMLKARKRWRNSNGV